MALGEHKPSKCVPCDVIYLDRVECCDWCAGPTTPIILPPTGELEPMAHTGVDPCMRAT